MHEYLPQASNWSTKMAGIIWLGSTSVQHVNNWQKLSCLPFLSLCKSRKFLETKTKSFISIKKKIICTKKFKNVWCKYGLHKNLPQAQQHLAPLSVKSLKCLQINRNFHKYLHNRHGTGYLVKSNQKY